MFHIQPEKGMVGGALEAAYRLHPDAREGGGVTRCRRFLTQVANRLYSFRTW